MLGTRHPIAPRKADWQEELAAFDVEPYCDGNLRQRGGGDLVLGSPFLALRHLVEKLATDAHNPAVLQHIIITEYGYSTL